MKYIRRFESRHITLPPDQTIILFINTTAIIDDELVVFKVAMDEFLKKDGKEYVGKNLEVFVHVSADFSNGNGLFYVEGGDYRQCNSEEWKSISVKFKKEGIMRTNDLKNTKAFKVYHISI